MESKPFLLFSLVLATILFLFVGVYGLGWGEFSDENGSSGESNISGEEVSGGVNTSEVNNISNPTPLIQEVSQQDMGESSQYTENYYLALWVGGGVVLLVIISSYLFFKKPRDDWKSKR
ncbi:MAG: hypothetical protein NUV97_03875 [archaeon]|nr:hypothetical protein [archaeon]MCR4323843.1 hypothetical protein [Nanoarchaeota archaeon]